MGEAFWPRKPASDVEDMITIGIDPGVSGGIAIIRHGQIPMIECGITVYKMPETETDLVDGLKNIAQHLGGCVAYLEKVHSMPKQGVASSFKFGQNYGMVRGVLAALGIRREFVSPQAWQKALGCMSKGDKNVTKSRAQELFPGIKITHAIADALLIAEYGRREEIRKNG